MPSNMYDHGYVQTFALKAEAVPSLGRPHTCPCVAQKYKHKYNVTICQWPQTPRIAQAARETNDALNS